MTNMGSLPISSTSNHLKRVAAQGLVPMETLFRYRSPSLMLATLLLAGLSAVSKLAIASSDTATLSIGVELACGTGVVAARDWGYIESLIGSYSPTGLTGRDVVAAVYDYNIAGASVCGSSYSVLDINSFSSDPGSSWLSSITCNGVIPMLSGVRHGVGIHFLV